MKLVDFKVWTAGALWEDTKFSVRYFKDIERLAIVGDKKWEKGVKIFCKPFTGATVRFFNSQAIDQAWEWINAPSGVAKNG